MYSRNCKLVKGVLMRVNYLKSNETDTCDMMLNFTIVMSNAFYQRTHI